MQAVQGKPVIHVIDDEDVKTQSVVSSFAMVGVLFGLVAFFVMFAPVS